MVEAEALLQQPGLLLGEPQLLGAVRPAATTLLFVLLDAAHGELPLLAAARGLVHVQVHPHVGVPVPVVASSCKPLCKTKIL
jgi:hypothetical protein